MTATSTLKKAAGKQLVSSRAQIDRLTRQNQALMRLAVGVFDGID